MFVEYYAIGGEKVSINIVHIVDILHYEDGSLLVSLSTGESRYVPKGSHADAIKLVVSSLRANPLT